MSAPTGIAGLLGQLCTLLDRHVVLPGEHARDAVALWVAHTWAIEGAHATPYLLVLSPEKRSGKTRLLEVLEVVVARPWKTASATEAALFRKLAKDRPTVMLDEVDVVFEAKTQRAEGLRAVLNAGNRRGGMATRCVGEGANQTVVDFDVFGPKILAGINKGQMPDTITDRSIVIQMRRAIRRRTHERFRARIVHQQAAPLRDQLATWAEAATGTLLEAQPRIPGELDDRAADAWEPLLAIAEAAGVEWATRARAAAVELSAARGADDASGPTVLLCAIRAVFGERVSISSAELCSLLNADEELPFGGWSDRKGIDPRALARSLRPFGIRPRTVRTAPNAVAGDGSPTPKGYRRDQFAHAFRQYLDGDGRGGRESMTPEPPQRHMPVSAADIGAAGDATAPNIATPHGPRCEPDVADVVGAVADVAHVADDAQAAAPTAPPAMLSRGTEPPT